MGIQSIERAVAVLELFKKNKQLGLAEITELIGLSKTTIHNIIKTLEENDLLRQNKKTKTYQLGYSILELGLKQNTELDINRNALGPLQKLSNDLNKICSVGIWDNNTILVTFRTIPHFTYAHTFLSAQPGPRIPAYCSTFGKAILAFMQNKAVEKYLSEVDLLPFTPNTITTKNKFIEELAQIKKRGYSIDEREFTQIMAIGAPIRGISGKLEGAISIRLDLEDYDKDNLDEFVGPLHRTAYEISMNMGYQPVPLSV
jgi:DNA-binding IclR family transcriptional regulator